MRHETSVVVNRPVDEVWAFMTDPFNVPRLGGGTLALRQTSPGPMGLGSTLQGRRVILGLETRMSGAITEWDPPRTVTISFVAAGGSRSFRGALEPTLDGTKVVRVIEFEPQPILKLLWPIVGPFFRREWDAATQNFKRLLEARD